MIRTRALALVLLLAATAPAVAQDDDSFKARIARGDYPALAETLRQNLDLDKADPALRSYLERNLSYLEAGAPVPQDGHAVILVRGARNDQVYNMPESSGGDALMLPNTIRYARQRWDARLKRINRYFGEATQRSASAVGGGDGAEQQLEAIIYDHASSTTNARKSVLISTSTVPQSLWGPPFYILKVAPERAIFNYKSSFSSEREVLLPFWILPKEIVAKCETVQEVLDNPVFQQSRFKDLSFGSSGYGSGGNQATWAVIEQNIREGRNPLEGVAGLNSYFPGRGIGVGPDASPAELAKFRAKVEARGGSVERIPAGDLRLPAEAQARTYLDSSGRPRVLLREGVAVKKLALIDELTHVIQIDQLLQARGPLEVDRLLLRAHGGDPAARDVVNRWEIRAKRMALLLLPQGDPAREAITRSIADLERELDPYARFRRAGSGTIDWKRAAKQAGGGMAHFGMALFLKELALVARTGDKLLIEEFFDGLTSTDFYVNYGLFSVGAAGADAAYRAFLEKSLARYVRPQFVRSVLRSNLTLAAGMALPELLQGRFDGRTFALDLAGLGLSSTAVKAATSGLRWVVDLSGAPRGEALLARLGRLKGLARAGGFVYQAAETAVVLYFGEQISRAIDTRLQRSQALERVRDATAAVLDAVRAGQDPAPALERLAQAHRDYRDLLLRPLDEAEAQLWQRLERAGLDLHARDEALARYQELSRARGGLSLDASVARVRTRFDAEGQRRVSAACEAYEARLRSLIPQLYGQPAPPRDLSAQVQAALDEPVARNPLGAIFQRLRPAARRRLLDQASELPRTRLAAYELEADFYAGLARALPGERGALAADLERRAQQVRRTADMEQGLVLGHEGARPASRPDPLVEGFAEALAGLEGR